MYNILISDDEHYIREGLMNAIDWKNFQFGKVLVASDGTEAKEKIDNFHPQVIITDIKMPGMDGLELTKYAMKLDKHTKVILLSGYSEFEYAQKAITYGVFEFILKPSNYEDLNRAIQNAVRQLKLEEEQNRELSKLKEEFQERIDFFRKDFLKKLILYPQINESSISRNLEESLNLYQLPKNNHNLLILGKIDQFNSFTQKNSVEEQQLLLLRLERKLLNYLKIKLYEEYGIESYVLHIKDELYAILVTGKLKVEESIIIDFCENFHQHLHGFPFTISFGVSMSKNSYLEINKAYLEASIALDYIFYYGNGAIILYSDLPTIAGGKTENADFNYYGEIKQIIKALKIGDKETCSEQLSYLFRLFEYNQEDSNKVRSTCIEIVSQIKTLIRHNKKNEFKDFPKELYTTLLSTETNESCLNILESIISPLLQEIQNQTKSNNKKIVQRVIDIIEQSYDQEISLTSVASKVYLNSSYVSRLLKKEYGKTFTELLTKCRMEKAKQILKDPTIKINEVSEKVGIIDSQYFSSKFKKYTGLTPSDYRDHFEDIF